MAVLLVLAFGLTVSGVLVVLASSEVRIVAAHVEASEARYVAESALDRVVGELQGIAAWDDILGGVLVSGWATVGRVVMPPGGEAIDVEGLTARLQAESDAGLGHGADSPRWQPFAWAPFTALVPRVASLESPFGVVVWVADDESEHDGDPASDGNQAIWVRAAAIGPGNARCDVEALVSRVEPAPGPLRRVVWRTVRPGD